VNFWTGPMSITAPGGRLTDFMGVPVVESKAAPVNKVLMAGGTFIVNDIPHFMYRLRMDAIKWQMRQDLKKQLDAFAARWGIER
jgi:hypothetical protein